MWNTSAIIKLLGAQKDVFSLVEDTTNQMLFEPAETLTDLITIRGTLLEKAVKIEDDIRLAANDDKYLFEVISCRCDMSALSEEFVGLFKAALSVKAALNRIRKSEADVLERVNDEKNTALMQIEALNKSSNSVAANYKHAVQTGFPQNFFQEKTRSV